MTNQEQGYTRIPNVLLDGILGANLGKRELLIVLAVARETIGTGRKSAFISLDRLADLTGLDRSNLSRDVVKLTTLQILIRTLSKQQRKRGYLTSLNANWQEWTVVKTTTLSKQQPSGVHSISRIRSKDLRTCNSVQNAEANLPVAQAEIEPDRFGEFWQAYPRKVNKKRAAQIWKTRKLDGMADQLIDDVRNRTVNDSQWRNGYIPHPTTYLHGDRWNDELQTQNAAGHGAPIGAAARIRAANERAEAREHRERQQCAQGNGGDDPPTMGPDGCDLWP